MDDQPEYDQSLKPIMNLFWDIEQYKDSFDGFLRLETVETYCRLFATQIHPFHINIIIQFDRCFTGTINQIINTKE